MKISKYYILLLTGLVMFLSTTAYLFRGTHTELSSRKTYNAVGKLYADNKIQDHSLYLHFNHKLHVKDNGIACKDCHTGAPGSTSSKDNLLPSQEVCASCHDVKDEKKCDYCHVNGKVVKLIPTPHELNFSHKFHIENQKQECTSCHVGLETVKYASESPTVFPPMEVCASCHNKQTAVMNCEACHTNLTGLKPKDHLQANFLNEHKVMTSDLSAGGKNCMMCHSDNFCQVCHSAPKYQGNNQSNDFYAPYYSKEGATRIDRDDLQKLTSVHTLNYRYNHSLDAENRSFECKTCHEPKTFCAECHQNDGETFSGVLPSSHRQPNFTTYGVNTGGGLHADLARKDIEQCQSCHDADGRDPICVSCHYDNNGVKGTHPKTHETGFMHDEKGYWHNSRGAVCYTCHTDPNARPDGKKGVGFCGYCHTQ